MKIIYNDGHVDECPADDELHVIRHTAAHILAQAVKHLYPQAHFAYGPATEKGFHYDVDLGDVKLSDEDLKTIEKEMQAIVKQNLPIKPFALGREEAIKLMQERGEIYKVEHIGDLPEDATLTFYQQGDYIDMCVGPHLCYTKALKAFKLTALSGAYWKNDKNNKMLTRISGIAFRNQEELNEYLKMMEEAEKRDHRKIGKEMGLFMLCDEGPGFPFFLPKGMQLKNALIDYWRDIHYAADYVEVSTPMIMSRHLWETSGHWDHYKDNMYSTKIDDEDYCIKPMNCPGGVMVYRSQPHSYRDLPLRVGELGLVHRHELRGAHLLYRRGVVVGLQLVDDVAHGGSVFGVGQGRRVLRADGFEAACGCGGRVGIGVELGGLEVELQAAEEVVARVVLLHQRIGVDVLRRARVAGVFVGQGGGHALVVGEEVVFRGEFLRNGFDEFVEQVVVFRVAGIADVRNFWTDDLHRA